MQKLGNRLEWNRIAHPGYGAATNHLNSASCGRAGESMGGKNTRRRLTGFLTIVISFLAPGVLSNMSKR